MKRWLTIFLLWPWAITGDAQEHFLTGRWEGNYEEGWFSLISRVDKLVVELFVDARNRVSGSTHLYYRNEYEHYTIHGTYRPSDSSIFLSEDSVLAIKMRSASTTCPGNYNMRLTIRGNKMRFQGKWKDNTGSWFGCGSSGVFLERPLPPKLLPPAMPSIAPTAAKQIAAVPSAKRAVGSTRADRNKETHAPRLPSIPNPAAFREHQVQSLIEISASERANIQLAIRDNADVDDDIISLYLDGEPIIEKRSLTAEPIVLNLTLKKKSGVSNLVMVAENLGEIPPCTAHIRVTTEKERYETNLSGDLNSNAVLQFFLKE